jgi:putative lipoic acid-binding regulatory protein
VSTPDPFEKFRALLEAHYVFPCLYTHKFIGKNSTIFKTSVEEFEKKFIGLTRSSERQSASGKHLSLTYDYHAANADEVITLSVETQKINDLIYIL